MKTFEVAELERRLANVIRLGTIAEADHDTKRIRVQSGDLVTAWLPWPAEVGNNYRRWRPLREGTQVVLAAPNGELAQAVVIGMLYTNDQAAPADDDNTDLVQFEDGTEIRYDSAASVLTVHSVNEIQLQADGDLTATVQGNFSATVGGDLNADVTGNVSIDGSKIELNGGKGVVTGDCICAFTGRPHSDKSSTVTAGK